MLEVSTVLQDFDHGLCGTRQTAAGIQRGGAPDALLGLATGKCLFGGSPKLSLGLIDCFSASSERGTLGAFILPKWISCTRADFLVSLSYFAVLAVA